MKHVIDPEGRRLPIKLDTTSNGEFVPVALSPANRAGNRLAHEAATQNAKRVGLSRRDFLVSAAARRALCPRSMRPTPQRGSVAQNFFAGGHDRFSLLEETRRELAHSIYGYRA